MPTAEFLEPFVQFGAAGVTAAAFIWFLMKTIESKDKQHAAEIERLVNRHAAEMSAKDSQVSTMAERFATVMESHQQAVVELRLELARSRENRT